jgi:hypothetical protein
MSKLKAIVFQNSSFFREKNALSRMLAVASDNECITHDTSISLSYQRPVAFPVKAAFSPLSLHGMRQGKPIQFS